MTVFSNTLEMIGNTPMLELTHLDTGPCRLFLKLELCNPGGSIKDRIAMAMVEAAENEGKLKPGSTLVEATAGNTGIGLALIANLKGYHLLLVIPDKMSPAKIAHLKAMGVEVILTRSDVEKGHPEYYQDKAERIAKELDNAFYINQFGNPNNPRAHQETTGPEIWQQMEHKIDALVLGAGTSGTVTGAGKFLKQQAPELDIILADPKGSILADYINTGHMGTAGKWLVEGIGEDYIPVIADLSLVNEGITVTDEQSFAAARELLIKEGIFAGSSTGTLLHAALEYCRRQTQPKRIVTIACDSGEKYLGKMFNDTWMWEQGFLPREQYGDLRDMVSHRHNHNETITISPEEPITTAIKQMKQYNISQLPVTTGNQIHGIISESEILTMVYQNKENLSKPVKEIMNKDFPRVSYDTKVDELLPMFAKGHVASVVNGTTFIGLITPIDLITHLARK